MVCGSRSNGRTMSCWTAAAERSWSAGAEQYLVRPDPQAIWDSPRKNPAWKRANARYLRSQYRRRPLGEEDPAGELEDPLPGPDLPGEAHELQAHGPVSGAGGQLGFRHGEDPERRAAHPGAEPVRLHRRGHGGLRQGGGQRAATWTRPRAWWPGPGKTPDSPAWGRPPSAGSWTTAASSWSGRSAGARPTTPSSWTRPATAGAPAARCGSWRTTSTPS